MRPASLIVGAILIAGCGGSSAAAGGGESSAVVRTVYRTPQSAVRGYIKGLEGLKGNVLCGVVDSSLRQSMVSYTVNSGIAEPGTSCAEALRGFAKADTKSSKPGFKLPRLHVAIRGRRAVVGYIGPRTHKRHTFVLVKSGPGWLIDRIDGSG